VPQERSRPASLNCKQGGTFFSTFFSCQLLTVSRPARRSKEGGTLLAGTLFSILFTAKVCIDLEPDPAPPVQDVKAFPCF